MPELAPPPNDLRTPVSYIFRSQRRIKLIIPISGYFRVNGSKIIKTVKDLFAGTIGTSLPSDSITDDCLPFMTAFANPP